MGIHELTRIYLTKGILLLYLCHIYVSPLSLSMGKTGVEVVVDQGVVRPASYHASSPFSATARHTDLANFSSEDNIHVSASTTKLWPRYHEQHTTMPHPTPLFPKSTHRYPFLIPYERPIPIWIKSQQLRLVYPS